MKYSPDLEREIAEFMAANSTPGPRRHARRHHMQSAPAALIDCFYCGTNLRGISTGVQTLGVLHGRYWRYHKCPSCSQRFVAGVSLADPDAIATADVQFMRTWFSRRVLRRMREEELQAKSVEWELAAAQGDERSEAPQPKPEPEPDHPLDLDPFYRASERRTNKPEELEP